MSTDRSASHAARWPVRPSLILGVLPVIVFAIVVVIEAQVVDGTSDSTTAIGVFRTLVRPEIVSAALLLLYVTALGWWRLTIAERRTHRAGWTAIAPALLLLLTLVKLPFVDWSGRSAGYFVVLAIGTLLVGIFEEILTRGVLLVGLRRRLSEVLVWAITSVVFGLLHAVNVLSGQDGATTIQQILYAIGIGSGFYVARRVTGTLIVPIVIHGLWDFVTTGVPAGTESPVITAVGALLVLAIIFSIVAGLFMALRNKETTTGAPIPSREG